MKLLLTSLGLTNATIRSALEDLTKKPISNCKVVFIPTAIYAMPDGDHYAWEGLQEQAKIGWTQLGVLELTALPSLREEHWLPALQAANVIMVGGGNTPFLCYWMHQSGLAQKLPDLLKSAVYVGVSAGSMVVSHSFNVNQETLQKIGIFDDDEYGDVAPSGAGSDKTLGLVQFTLRPHLNVDYFQHVSLADMERAASKVDVPLYAIDDQTAIKVDGSTVEVVSEGQWKLFS